MAQVKSYKRRTKSGKIVTVKAHSRKGKEGVSSMPIGGSKSRRSGDEFSRIKDAQLQKKISDYVTEATDGEYSNAATYDWKTTLRALRHPAEGSVRANVSKKFGISLDSASEGRRTSSKRRAMFQRKERSGM